MAEPASIAFERRLEWSETDPMGRWHYSAVFKFVEAAETALHMRLGIAQETFPRLPRAQLTVDFLAPLHFSEVAQIHLAVERVGRSSLRYVFAICQGTTELARGGMTVVWVDPVTERSAPWPDHLREVLMSAGPVEPVLVR
jgi:acyl-CoA thioester hydrolase